MHKIVDNCVRLITKLQTRIWAICLYFGLLYVSLILVSAPFTYGEVTVPEDQKTAMLIAEIISGVLLFLLTCVAYVANHSSEAKETQREPSIVSEGAPSAI